ncbi:MAG: hypothetical protein IIC55_02275 [Proteobacteria bacterium]|nr:hypothetical protein [Pseudomonadota bacterium]
MDAKVIYKISVDRRIEMRALMILGLSIILLAAPSSSYADGNVVDTVTTTVKENPGKSTGVAACAAIIIFPPAAIWCAATLVGGATYDGDVQKLVKEAVK